MGNSKIIWIIVAIVVVVGGWFFWKGGVQPTSAGPIKIGFIGPLTGDASSIGTVNRAAVDLAAEEVNQAGGINGRPLEVIYEDGQCNAKAATNAANKLINIDRVSVIFGGLCSSETSAFGPMAMENKVIVISSASSAPSLSKLGKYFFRSYPSDAFQGKFGAEYAYNTLGARKVAIVYHISEWGSGIKEVFEKRFKELGGQVLTADGAPPETRDYRTVLSKVKALQPDIIYFPAYPEGSTAALKQAQDLGIKTKMFGADAWDTPQLHKDVSGRGDFLYTAPVTPAPDEFRAKVLARSGGDAIPVGTPNAYDNVKMIAQVMKKVGTNTEKIQAELRKLQYNGVSGQIAFDANGDLTSANYIVKRIQNGSAVEVK